MSQEHAAAARTAAIERQAAAARHQADRLVDHTRVLVRNGVDLRHPAWLESFTDDQVREAVAAANVTSTCVCGVANGEAAMALIAELARRLAEATR